MVARYDAELLRSLYTMMLRIRCCEESFVEPILTREVLCPVHLYTGEEAVAAGVGAALAPNDAVFGNHRSHGHYLAKGGDLRAMVAELYCREGGCCRGRGGSMHLSAPEQGVLGVAPIVGGTISLAVGAALAFQSRGEARTAVSFFGDGATGEGVLAESLNFAALHALPIIFACENNYYSTHLPLQECRPRDNIHELGDLYGIEGRRVDGNDVLRVYHAAAQAVARCRSGRGPCLIEFATYRMRGHVGPDDNIQGTHTDIRPESEVARWRRRDPIARFERKLLRWGIMTPDEIASVQELVKEEVAEAHAIARKSAWPKAEELSAYVFRD